MKMSWTVFKRTQKKKSWGITQKMYQQEILFFWSARRLIMLYIAMKFHDTILNDFKLQSRPKITMVKFQWGNNSKKMYRQELLFFWSARCLMILYISMKFRENILVFKL